MQLFKVEYDEAWEVIEGPVEKERRSVPVLHKGDILIYLGKNLYRDKLLITFYYPRIKKVISYIYFWQDASIKIFKMLSAEKIEVLLTELRKL